MHPRVKRWIWTLLRLALCAAALTYVVSRTSLHDMVWLQGQETPVRLIGLHGDSAEVVLTAGPRTVPLDQLQTNPDRTPRISWGLASLASRSDKAMLLAAVAVYGLLPLLQVVRFRWMLALQDIHLGWLAALRICFLGHFYSYVIPGTTGGDLVRAGYLMRNHVNRHGALVAILLDRLTGLAGMFALAGVVGLLVPVANPTVRYAARVSVVALACMVGGFAAVTGWGWMTRLLGRLPLGSHLQQLYEAASAGRRGWPVLLASVGLTMVLQSAAMAAFSIVAVALGMAPAWQQYFVCLPVALVIAAVPIVPMGAGTQEAAMVFLLAGQVGSVSQVVGLALVMRLIGLTWALPGGLVPLLQSPRPAAPVNQG